VDLLLVQHHQQNLQVQLTEFINGFKPIYIGVIKLSIIILVQFNIINWVAVFTVLCIIFTIHLLNQFGTVIKIKQMNFRARAMKFGQVIQLINILMEPYQISF